MPWPPPPPPPLTKTLNLEDSTATPLARSKAQSQNYVVNKSYSLVLAADNVPQQVPGFSVPEGTQVRVRANNGATAGNAAMIFVGSFPGAFKAGHGIAMTAVDDIQWPVSFGGHIWVYGKKGDGVIVSVTTVSGL